MKHMLGLAVRQIQRGNKGVRDKSRFQIIVCHLDVGRIDLCCLAIAICVVVVEAVDFLLVFH